MDSSRRMIYPYTFTGKVALFPYKFYWNNSWAFKYYIISFGLCIPIFYKFQQGVNSPANVAKFEEQARKEKEEHRKHLEHLL